jgi:hypothetical protein
VTTIASALQLETAGGRALLAVELGILLLLALFMVLFLFHDLVVFIISVVAGYTTAYHSFQVLIACVIVVTVSLTAVFLREMLAMYLDASR